MVTIGVAAVVVVLVGIVMIRRAKKRDKKIAAPMRNRIEVSQSTHLEAIDPKAEVPIVDTIPATPEPRDIIPEPTPAPVQKQNRPLHHKKKKH